MVSAGLAWRNSAQVYLMSNFLFGPKAQAAPVTQAATADQANQAYGNTQQGLGQQQAFLQALQAQGGLQNQSNVYNQLAMQAAGQGPNPAQQALANATGANVANQAALMAGQRGAGANAGLIARQAAQQGAGIQQQAAGQGALMQAQQQQAALGQMGDIANQQVALQGNQANAYTQNALGQQQNVYGAIGNQNNANIAAQKDANEANKGRGFASILGGLGKAAAGIATGGASLAADAVNSSFASGGMAHGGEVPKDGPQSEFGKALHGLRDGGEVPGEAKVKGDSLENDVVPAMLSPGEMVIPKSVMESKDPVKSAAAFVKAHMTKRQHAPSKSNSKKK